MWPGRQSRCFTLWLRFTKICSLLKTGDASYCRASYIPSLWSTLNATASLVIFRHLTVSGAELARSFIQMQLSRSINALKYSRPSNWLNCHTAWATADVLLSQKSTNFLPKARSIQVSERQLTFHEDEMEEVMYPHIFFVVICYPSPCLQHISYLLCPLLLSKQPTNPPGTTTEIAIYPTLGFYSVLASAFQYQQASLTPHIASQTSSPISVWG